MDLTKAFKALTLIIYAAKQLLNIFKKDKNNEKT